jgi:hypothetical protein
VPHVDHHNKENVVLDGVDDPIIAYTEPISGAAA